MLDGYDVPDDGKLHTRYSDLVQCTDKGTIKVAKRMLLGGSGYFGDSMGFGRLRHEMFEEESKITGRTPAVFKEVSSKELLKLTGTKRVDWKLDFIEKAWSAEIFEGIVLHSRTDAYAPELEAIIDYKTATPIYNAKGEYVGCKKSSYTTAKQLYVYAHMLIKNGIPVKRLIYLLEAWDERREKLIGYDVLVVPFDIVKYKERVDWLKERCERLVVAIDVLKNDYGILEDVFS